MVLELLHSGALGSVVAEHFEDEVLELGREVLAAHLLPVLVQLVVQDQVVEIFVFFGLLEWENTLDNNKEDNTG